MASFIRSWIVSSIISHDEQHGADLSPQLSNPVFCQLVKFTSFRTASQPSRQISAVVSDRTHRVSVVFERHAADSYEQSKAGENPELLTSSIRSTLRLTEYSISLLPQYPVTAQLDNVRVQLVVHRWAVVTGDGNEPVYFPHTVQVGRGGTRADAEVNRILRKWWLGDSQKSQPSLVTSEEVHPGTFKRLKRVNQLVADLSAAGKALPAWLFTPASEAQRAELDAIDVFGTDPFKPEPESLESNGHSGSLTNATQYLPTESTNGTQYLSTESPRAQPPDSQTQYLPSASPRTHESLHESAQVPQTSRSPTKIVPPTSRSPTKIVPPTSRSPTKIVPPTSQSPIKIELAAAQHTQPVIDMAIDISPPLRTGRFETPSDSDDEDSDSISIPIRFTSRRTKPPRRQVFKSSPQVPRASSQPTGETDEDDLSDYEKEQRRAQKRPVPSPQLSSPSMPRKRPRHSGASNVDADDEASQERPRKLAKAEIVSPIKSSWEPTPGQRVLSRLVSVSVSEAVRQVLPKYRPDLTTFTVPGMSKEMVEYVRARAVEEKAARERGQRKSGR
ncbi:hypothetical protein CcaverHIS002_0406360 [Cutaneotrichosporon cavernicola]|nr:hypothetical protein CcaverHIS002_0406360 [Cutaneotrichosporon cavernicola]BEI99590.1 hypothetical protein CcaverHIS631_0406330 [Cutaneotrichosporon cavernicola]BEJ07366.1 hypothetical protein CcaverHIS641_0406350 [Cutaneotrichosporon cavernicola]